MKKLIAFLLSMLVAVSFSACKNDDITNPGMHTTQTKKQEEAESETTTQQATRINQSTVIDSENLPKIKTGGVITGKKDESSISGYAPLDGVTYPEVRENTAVSSQRIEHSHGPARHGKAHQSVLETQELLSKYGGVTVDTECNEKVIYLTFDCGYEYDNLTSSILDTLREKDVPAAFFSTLDHMKKQPELIARMIKEGHIVGNHSATHPDFTTVSREQAVKELEETENYLRTNFGYVAKYFRFPTGAYSESMLETVSSMGYMSVFWSVAYDDWDAENVRGKQYTIDKVMSRLHDGAVVLLHGVSRDNANALGDIIDMARAEGYEFRPLTALSF